MDQLAADIDLGVYEDLSFLQTNSTTVAITPQSTNYDDDLVIKYFVPQNIVGYVENVQSSPSSVEEDFEGSDDSNGLEQPKKRRLREEFAYLPKAILISNREKRDIQRLRVRTSEKKRRERLTDCFDKLKELLPAAKKDRGTKEDILKETIEYVQQLQKQLADHRMAIARPQMSFNQDDLYNTFQMAFRDASNRLSYINTQMQLQTFSNLYYYILDLASKSNEIQVKLQAYTMQIYFNTYVQNNFMKALALVEKAYPLFQEVYAKGQRPLFKDQDLGAFLISDYAYILVSLGQIDKAVELRRYAEEYGKAEKRAWTTVHYNHYWYFFQLGEPMNIEDAFLLMESVKDTGHAYMGKLVYASTVLQHAETEVGKEEMLKFLENTVSTKANEDSEEAVCINKMLGFMISGYQASDPKKALKELKYYANKIEKQGFGAYISKPDMLRMQAECLVSLVKSKNLPSTPQVEKEIAISFRDSFEIASARGLLTCALKSIYGLLCFYESIDQREKAAATAVQLQELLKKLKTINKSLHGKLLLQIELYVELYWNKT